MAFARVKADITIRNTHIAKEEAAHSVFRVSPLKRARSILIKRYTVSAKTKTIKIGFNKQGINTPIIKNSNPSAV